MTAGRTLSLAGAGSARAALEVLLQLVFPPSCLVCEAPLLGSTPALLCARCHARLDFIGAGACRFCGGRAGAYAALGKGCARCSPHALAFTRAAAVVEYNPASRALVHEFKFSGNRSLARHLGLLMARRLGEVGMPARYDCVVPVPLHPRRLRARGYNQSALLAGEVAARLGLRVCADLLRRVRDTRPQAGLGTCLRARNPVGAFSVGARLDGAQLLLVDDVLTTGATAGECARVLRQAGAARVYVLLFAR